MTNAGFNYTDRRKPAGKSSKDPEEVSRLKILYVRYKLRIEKYKRRIDVALREKDVFELDELL